MFWIRSFTIYNVLFWIFLMLKVHLFFFVLSERAQTFQWTARVPSARPVSRCCGSYSPARSVPSSSWCCGGATTTCYALSNTSMLHVWVGTVPNPAKVKVLFITFTFALPLLSRLNLVSLVECIFAVTPHQLSTYTSNGLYYHFNRCQRLFSIYLFF